MTDKQIKLDVEAIDGHPNARMIRFEGDLDSTNVEKTLGLVTKLLGEGARQFVADFSRLRYLNSTGLGILLHISKTARQHEGCFKIARVNENVYEIIEIIGAHTLLDIYDKIEDAIDSLK